MKTLMDKYAIIKLKKEGLSNRKAAKLLNINRKTVARYWNEYQVQQQLLQSDGIDIQETQAIQEKICSEPTYNVKGRKPYRYTEEMDLFLDEVLENETEKCKLLGHHKQYLTQSQIYNLVKEKGFDISKSTICNKIREKRNKPKECYIRQDYDYGDRLEYDFGEVKLVIDGVVGTYHMAVLSSPAANYRWAYLYKNQKKEVFMDSHVQFFERMKGVHKEIVYDNMKNVVTKFIGPHEKELNKDLLKLSLYYGFDINVTNCYSGNEKGHVEGSVKIIRNKIFSLHYKFKTFEEASDFLQEQLIYLNEKSLIHEEMKHLLPYKEKLELAELLPAKIDKYSFARYKYNFYSVPEYLVGKHVTMKIYHDYIRIYSNHKFVCEHKKIDGENEISIELTHYLNTFSKKPGALRNSLALKSLPQLKSIYDTYFNKNPKEFIAILQNNADKSIVDIINILSEYKHSETNIIPFNQLKDKAVLGAMTRTQTQLYNNICIKGGLDNGR